MQVNDGHEPSVVARDLSLLRRQQIEVYKVSLRQIVKQQ